MVLLCVLESWRYSVKPHGMRDTRQANAVVIIEGQ